MTFPSLRLFGAPTLLSVAQQPITGGAAQPRRLAVLAVLAEAWPAAISRDALIARIWPDQDSTSARRVLTQALYVLRRELGDVILADGDLLTLQPAALRTDLIAFREAVAARDDVRVLALHRGPFLEGLQLKGVEEFERWAAAVRETCLAERAAAELRFGTPAVELVAPSIVEVPAAPREDPAPTAQVIMPAVSVDAPVPRRRWRAMALAGAVLGAAAVAAALWPARASRAQPAALESVHLVVVAPFEARGDVRGASDASGLADLLARSLDGLGRTRTQTGSAANAWGVVRGTVTYADSAARVDVQLRADGQPVVRASVTVPRDSVLLVLDRIAVGLAPGLRPRLLRGISPRTLAGISLGAMRAYLDGEDAAARHAYETAYAAFSAATDADTTFAWGWYRRAMAAEWTTRSVDADLAIGEALARSASLPAQERQLIAAFGHLRRGEVAQSEAIYRALVGADWRDRDVWMQLGEIAFHTGPLRGRPVQLAADAWDRALALDSTSFIAVTHALRLAAQARDTATVMTLLARLDAEPATTISEEESRVLAALAVGTPAMRARAEAALDTLPDYSLFYLHAISAGMLEDLDASQLIAERLITADRPDAVRAQGYVSLAHLQMARGRWKDAFALLESAAGYNSLAVAWARAQFATLPFAALPATARAGALRQLRATSPSAVAPPLSLDLTAEATAAPVISGYLTSLLGAEPLRGALDCPRLADPVTRSLCSDLAAGALVDPAGGAAALATLEQLAINAPYQLAGRSSFFARTRERWLRAELMMAAGRPTEQVADWLASVPQGARLDYIYLAPSHLRRGQLRERSGDTASAVRHYRVALDLLRSPDPEFADLAASARAGIERLTAGRVLPSAAR